MPSKGAGLPAAVLEAARGAAWLRRRIPGVPLNTKAAAQIASRDDERELPPSVSPIDLEMGVERKDLGAGMRFRETDKAGVRQGHGQIPVLVHQIPKRLPLGEHRKIRFNESGSE